jgi:hypothetical protein
MVLHARQGARLSAPLAVLHSCIFPPAYVFPPTFHRGASSAPCGVLRTVTRRRCGFRAEREAEGQQSRAAKLRSALVYGSPAHAECIC